MTETQSIPDIISKLTERPRLALSRWRSSLELDWTEVVALAAKPADRQSMPYRAVLLPLEVRGLAEMCFPGAYYPETGTFEHKRYRLTPLGLSVRSALQLEQG